MKSAAAAAAAARERDLGRRGGGGGRGRQPGRRRGCRRQGRASPRSLCPPPPTWRRRCRRTTPVIHPELGDNLCFQRVNESGKVDEAFAAAHKVVEATFHSGRHTGVTLEPRSILADYNRASGKLTVHHATQAPHMMQGVFAKHLRTARGRRARHLHRCRRQLRHQGARLPRRDGGGRHGQDHGPAGEVHRRSAGELRQRHPRPRPPHQGAAWPSTPRAASPPSTSTI